MSMSQTLACLKYWLWKLLTILILGPIYCCLIADGLRLRVPVLGVKLYKLPIPGFSSFGDFVESRGLDLAMFMAIFLLFAVWWSWERVLRIFLSNGDSFQDTGWDSRAYKRLVLMLGIVLLTADGAIFYIAATQMGWGGAKLSASALLITVAYLAVIVFVSFVSLNLRKPIDGH